MVSSISILDLPRTISANPSIGSQSLDYARTAIREIAAYVKELRHQSEASKVLPEYGAKKRKLNDGAPLNERAAQGSNSIQSTWTTDNFEGISFSVPARKKCALQISRNRKTEGVRAVAQGETSVPEFGLLWSQVEHVICLPVPEKAQPQKNFCVLPKGGDGITPAGTAQAGETEESIIVWTAADTKPKGAAEDELTQAQKIVESLAGAKCNIQGPDAKEFVSEVPPPGRKGEKAYHVKAFKGNKDGKYHSTLLLPAALILKSQATSSSSPKAYSGASRSLCSSSPSPSLNPYPIPPSCSVLLILSSQPAPPPKQRHKSMSFQ